jgi:hypothetical protein
VGGISTQENLNVGAVAKVISATDATSKTTGALIVTGGLGVAKNIHGKNVFVEDVVSNSVVILDTTTSDGKTAGALIVAGGVGVSGALFGADANLEDVTADSVTASGMVKGATISGTNVYGTLAGANTAAVTTLTASGMVKGATISGTNVYGTLAGANTAAVTTLTATSVTASAMVKGATISGTNVYGTLAGANTAAVTSLTASGMVKGATISGTNVYGTLAGANTAAVTTLTASGMVKGATISGTNVYGTLAGSNAAAMTTLNASGVVTLADTTTSTSATTGALKVAGGISTQENLHIGGVAKVHDTTTSSSKTTGSLIVAGGAGVSGPLFGAAATLDGVVTLSDTTTSTSATTGALKVAGGISTQENLNVGGDLKVDTSVLVVNSTTNRVGINKATPGYALDVDGDINFTGTFRYDDDPFVSTPWTIESSPTALSYTSGNVGVGAINPAAKLTVTGDAQITTTLSVGGVVTLTDATDATSSTSGALKAAGGVGIAKDVFVGERAYVTGGLITNTGGLGRKTYSLSNSMPASVSPTTNIHFTSNIFYAKITATLVDRNEHVSTILLDVNGGSQAGSINSGSNVISVGNQTIFGTTNNATPWASNVSTTANTVALYTSGAMAVSGNVHVFVEYMSPTSGGGVHAIAHNGDALATFGY